MTEIQLVVQTCCGLSVNAASFEEDILSTFT